MTHAPITYRPTETDRRNLSLSFGVDIARVPKLLTGGQLDECASGVTFLEMLGGHRIALTLSGSPTLARAASAALAQVGRKAG